MTRIAKLAAGLTLGSNKNVIGTLAGVSATGIVLVDSQALTLSGVVSAGNTGTVDISTTSGGVTQVSGGTVNAAVFTSTSSIAAGLTLGSVKNTIGTLGPVTATNIVLVDNQGFAIAGNVSVGASGKVDLSTINGSITQVTEGTLNAGTLTSGGGIAIGPVLLGAAKLIHILTPSATVRRMASSTGHSARRSAASSRVKAVRASPMNTSVRRSSVRETTT